MKLVLVLLAVLVLGFLVSRHQERETAVYDEFWPYDDDGMFV